jgi:hypothetical protein
VLRWQGEAPPSYNAYPLLDVAGDDTYTIPDDADPSALYDDNYLLQTHSGGSGDLGAIGLFYDGGGNDSYRFLVPPPGDANAAWAETAPLGSTTHYPDPFHTFRDDVMTFGVFIDAAGLDTYQSVDDGVVPERADGNTWTERRSEHEQAIGVDR